jgi:3-oxosteroid 1-dehydrogenase
MKWDYSFDIVVIGSGNAALTAALCNYEMGSKNILIVEKTEQYGGTSAIGGGGVWIPCNHYALAAGADDSLEDALSYLKSTTPEGAVDETMQWTFLENGPKMMRFLHDKTDARYVSLGEYPDYYSDAPGARLGHRSVEPETLDITQLQDEGDLLRGSHYMMHILGMVPITQQEAHIFTAQLKGWMLLAMKLVFGHLLDLPRRLKRKRSRRAAEGMAGVARLALSVEKRSIPLWLGATMTDLIEKDGRISGVVINRDGKSLNIMARKAVILGSGGFERNQAMREKYLPKPTSTEWTSGSHGNTGGPIEIALNKGATVKAMDGAWWCTMIKVPGEDLPRLSIMEKSYPGSVVINRDGKRIANESMNYQKYVQECFEAQEQGTPVDPLWLVFDASFRYKYLVGPLMTGKMMPDRFLPKHFFSPEFLTKADTIEELARQTGIDQTGLLDTVSKMNAYARTGEDLEFQRGSFHYDRYYGDPEVEPNNCLAPIETGPFYAIRLYLGDFGTSGGLAINTDAQVLRDDGSVIEGLYAAGNCTAPVLPTYPGPGATLGPAMTFAYQAAKHINNFSD